MSSPPAPQLAELHRLIKRADHKGVFTLCSRLIASGYGANDIIQCKIIAAHSLKQFQDGIDACGTAPEFAFYRAYGLYRLEKLAEATAALAAVPDQNDEKVKHLKAQILYRQSRYADAIPIYEGVLKALTAGGADAQDVWDAQLNLAAVLVAAGSAAAVLAHPLLADVVTAVIAGKAAEAGIPHEVVFNVACALIDDGRVAAACRALEAALAIGGRFMAEEMQAGPAETAAELAPMRAQVAYLLQVSHYDEAAQALYSSIAGAHASGKGSGSGGGGGAGGNASPLEASLAATLTIDAAVVRANSALVTRGVAGSKAAGRELLDAHKKVTAACANMESSKLTRRQASVLQFNRAVLLFAVGKSAEAGALLAELRAGLEEQVEAGKCADPSIHALLTQMHVLDAAVRAQGELPAAGRYLHDLARRAANVTDSFVPATLAANVQLMLAEGKVSEAASALMAHVSTTLATPANGRKPTHPALACTAAQLLTMDGREEEALKVLASCADSWVAAAAAKTAFGARTRSNAIQALHAHAGALLRTHKLEAASERYQSITRLAGVTPEQKAAALACLANVRMQQAAAAGHGSGAGAVREGFAADADRLLKEASAAVGAAAATTPTAARRGSRAGLAAHLGEDGGLDSLEWTAPDQRRPSAAAAAASGGAGGGAPASPSKAAAAAAAAATAAPGAPAAAAPPLTPEQAAKAAAQLAARTEARKKKLRAKRAKRKEKWLAAKTAAGKLPDPPRLERWIAEKDRASSRMRKKAPKGYTGGGGHQGGGNASLTQELDARAKAEANKAKKEKEAAAKATAAATAAATSAAKKKGKR